MPGQGGAKNRVGLIGWPVAHSVSPAMHNAAFRALGLDWRYKLWPTLPGALAAALAALGSEGRRGANVTLPHKEDAVAHVDTLDEAARDIGAVNTVVVSDAEPRRLSGHNTDAAGFAAALRAGGFEPAGRRALVLGAGGGARAVVYALGRAGCAVALHNRTALRAGALAREFDALGLPVAAVAGLGRLDLDAFDLLVNATSVGMAPGVDASPWPDALPLPAHWTVYDLVYNPAQTRLLARAEGAGARALGGLSMLVHQGALAFRLWTGQPAPVDIMHAAAREALP